MRESKFQSDLRKKISQRLPESIILKQDSVQGMPDLLILNGPRWGSLECKREEDSHHQPNQDYWVDRMNGMSYSSFVYPENEEAVLNDLQQALETR